MTIERIESEASVKKYKCECGKCHTCYMRNYYQRPEAKEKHAARMKAYRQKNHAKITANKSEARRKRKSWPRVFFPFEKVPITEISYHAMHEKVALWRGNASLYLCASCRAVVAREWSYNKNGGTNERHGITAGKSVSYSLDVWHYEPLCKSCHVYKDMKHE